MKEYNLTNTWHVQIDPEDRGLEQQWFLPGHLTDGKKIAIPGCLEENRIGNQVDNRTTWIGSLSCQEFYTEDLYKPYHSDCCFKFPYWLQPETVYRGAAWYYTDITFPSGSAGTTWELSIERAHWQTSVWINGKPLGTRDSLSVPHRYTFSPASDDSPARLVVRVDNRMIYDIGKNSSSISDQTQGSWNGLIGKIELRPLSVLYIEKVHAFPDIETKSVRLDIFLVNRENVPAVCNLSATINRDEAAHVMMEKNLPSGESVHTVTLKPDEKTLLWSEFSPELINIQVSVKDSSNRQVLDTYAFRTGLRQVSTGRRHILINNKPVFLRGTVECCDFPKTGHPPVDINSWRMICRKAVEYGFNHLRFHSWCPPEAAFTAADEYGVYVQAECPLWINQGSVFVKESPLNDWLYEETARIVDEYGNHPSFIMLAGGNEPDGLYEEVLGKWEMFWKKKDSRRLYTASSGWPSIDENDYHVTPAPRIQQWGEGLKSRINDNAPETESNYNDICEPYQRPVVTHEMGQWCAFPDFKEIPLYTGYLKAKNFEIFSDILKRRGMSGQAEDFLYASGKLQLLCYKEEIESALRTRNLTGFQLLGLTDFSGQGTATVGVLNAFWKEKGYCTKEEFSPFCGPVVLLALLPRRYYTQNQNLDFSVEIADFSTAPSSSYTVLCKILDDSGALYASSEVHIAGEGTPGLTDPVQASFPLHNLKTPSKYTLYLELGGSAEKIHNSWNFWVYPADVRKLVTGTGTKIDDSTYRIANVYVTTDINAAEQMLSEGRKVFLTASPSCVKTDVATGFSSVFWNTAWTNLQAPHTLGIVCSHTHPVFNYFPTENWSDWQWWEPLHGAASMILDAAAGIKPLIQPVDTWFRSHKLALLFECRIASGNLMVSSIDFSDLNTRVVVCQLFYSIIRYMQSSHFEPAEEINSNFLQSLFLNK